MQALQALGTELLFEKDLSRALHKVLTLSANWLGAEIGLVQLMTPERDRMVVAARYPPPDQDKDASTDQPTRTGSQQTGSSDRHTVALTSRQGKLLGYLTIGFTHKWQPSREQLGVLDLYAQQASAFIEHIQVQQALHGREAYLTALFDHAPVGLSEISLDGHFLRVNRALCQMLGRNEQELLAASVADVTAPADLSKSMEAVMDVLRTGEVKSLDKHYVRRDGGLFPATSILNRLLDESQQPAAILAVTVDQSERRQAEEALRKSEERYRTLFESMNEGFCLFEPMYGVMPVTDKRAAPEDFRVVEVNPAFEVESGFPNPTGKTLSALAKGSECFWLDYLRGVFVRGGTQREVVFARSLGRWFSVNAFTVERGSQRRIAVLFSNVSEQKRVQDELLISNERLKLAVEAAGDGIWDWNVKDDSVTLSEGWAAMLGYQVEELDRHAQEWRTRVHPDDYGRVTAELNACLNGTTTAFGSEYRMRCKNGHYKWVLSRGIVVKRAADRRPLRMTGMMSDISQRKEADELIWRHANFDALTSLPNRRLFRDRLDQEVRKAQRTQTQLALLFIDLDHFKQVNDLLGHDAGDLLLQQAAHRLRACTRESDTVARLGGDEFTVILSNFEGYGHVELVAQKILEELARPFSLGQEVSYLSGSIGVTMYPADATSSEELIRKADHAMYAAKSAGQNRFSYFTEAMDRRAHTRLRLATELRSALEHHELMVYYQPVVDLNDGRITKAEALLRWKHPRLGLVLPSEFIPVAEESGAIIRIGEWVFRQAAQCSREWGNKMGSTFQISVNRSPAQFLSRVGEDPVDCLHALGISGRSISVEITEGLLLNAAESVTDRLIKFRDAGMQVAIDDFGTGYSSMAYLKRVDIDYLKIDKSFIRDMEYDEGDRAIAESIIVMAHRLGLKVIAEGIETEGQRDLLKLAGCDYGQGFYYSEAVPPAAFAKLLEQSPF